jgi:cytochrome P450
MDNVVLTLVFARSDTTASAVVTSLLCLVLSTHPKLKAQLKAMTNLSSVYGNMTIGKFQTRLLAAYPRTPFGMRLNADSDPVRRVTGYDVPTKWTMLVYGFAGDSAKSEPDWNAWIEKLVF